MAPYAIVRPRALAGRLVRCPLPVGGRTTGGGLCYGIVGLVLSSAMRRRQRVPSRLAAAVLDFAYGSYGGESRPALLAQLDSVEKAYNYQCLPSGFQGLCCGKKSVASMGTYYGSSFCDQGA